MTSYNMNTNTGLDSTMQQPRQPKSKSEKQDEYDKVKKNPKKIQCDAIEGLRASLS